MKTNKHIIVKNCTRKELKTILNNWLALYASDLKSDMYFGIAEISPNVYILKVDKDLDDEIFFYLVNYCAYPEGFQKIFEVEGHATLEKPEILQNKKIRVFISNDDTEFDNVWITTEEDETYKYDFSGKYCGECRKVACNNRYKPLDTAHLPKTFERIDIGKLVVDAKEKEDEAEKRGLKKRFNIISIALLLLLPLVFLINRHFLKLPDEIVIIFPSVYITIWFIEDCKIFSDPNKLIICLTISSVNVIFGTNDRHDPMGALTTIVAAMPFSTAIVMWAGRKFLGAKLDYFEKRYDRLFFLVSIALAVFMSAFVIYPIIHSLK